MQKEARFRELIEQQQESGLTIKEFCSNQGVAPATFHYWKKKLVNKSRRNDFIPLLVKPIGVNTAKRAPRNRSRLYSETESDKEVFAELIYPNGTLLRLKNDVDLAQLRTLIHLYD